MILEVNTLVTVITILLFAVQSTLAVMLGIVVGRSLK
jgi:hypothetical protein